MVMELTAGTRKGTVRLLDTETGEVIAEGHTYHGEQAARTLKGWIFNRRDSYKRRTGRTLKVEEVA